ncbi:MAG: alpha-amylase family glycosyl hydrolase [Bacteroidales bacterium]|nr:alpha-amylase family glycosyl hydrolase [Bacteroidales bacterium]
MNADSLQSKLRKIWQVLYPESPVSSLDDFIDELKNFKKEHPLPSHDEKWYKDAIVYSLYVDLFNEDFDGLEAKLPYFAELGVNTLWLLPILESPMKDAGFDISRYNRVRHELLGLGEDPSDEERENRFRSFLKKAHEHGLKVIFDVAMNQHFRGASMVSGVPEIP